MKEEIIKSINKMRKDILRWKPIIVDGKIIFSQDEIDKHLASLDELEAIIKNGN